MTDEEKAAYRAHCRQLSTDALRAMHDTFVHISQRSRPSAARLERDAIVIETLSERIRHV